MMALPEREKLKVLHLVKTSVGAPWALLQMHELAKLGVELHVALPAGGPLVPRYEAGGVTVHTVQLDFPAKAQWRLPKVFKEMRNLVSSISPHIIHSHFVGTTLTARLALGKNHPVPRIFQVPGPLHLEHAFFRRAELLTAGQPLPSGRANATLCRVSLGIACSFLITALTWTNTHLATKVNFVGC